MFFGDSSRVPGPYVLAHLVIFTLRPVWRGINAPTCPFCIFSGVPSPWLLGFSFGEILYLCAVGILWYLVGRLLDDWRGLNGIGIQHRFIHSNRAAQLAAGWGLFLLVISGLWIDEELHLLDGGIRTNLRFLLTVRPENALTYVLFLLWSAMLIFAPGAKLARRFRPKFAEHDPPIHKAHVDVSVVVVAVVLSYLGAITITLLVWGTTVSAGAILFKGAVSREFSLLALPLSVLVTGLPAFVLIFRKIRSLTNRGIVTSS